MDARQAVAPVAANLYETDYGGATRARSRGSGPACHRGQAAGREGSVAQTGRIVTDPTARPGRKLLLESLQGAVFRDLHHLIACWIIPVQQPQGAGDEDRCMASR